jgi:hypothetical protein
MDRYELPIKVSRISGGYSVALALNDQTIISRQMSRADLMQLRAMLDQLLGPVPRDEEY